MTDILCARYVPPAKPRAGTFLDLLDLVALALPYVEEAATDPANKPAGVLALARRMREAIERAEGKR